jgi:hypothetical protein
VTHSRWAHSTCGRRVLVKRLPLERRYCRTSKGQIERRKKLRTTTEERCWCLNSCLSSRELAHRDYLPLLSQIASPCKISANATETSKFGRPHTKMGGSERTASAGAKARGSQLYAQGDYAAAGEALGFGFSA